MTGAISRHSAGWMGPRSFPSRLRRIRRIQLCSASPRRTFSTLSKVTRRSWPASPRLRVWRRTEEGFPIKVDGEIVGAIGVSGAPTVQNDVDCARAALALVSDVNRTGIVGGPIQREDGAHGTTTEVLPGAA